MVALEIFIARVRICSAMITRSILQTILNRQPFLVPFLLIVLLPSTLSAQESDEYYRGIARGLELFGEVYREILERYAGEVDPALLAIEGIEGMLATLDPYTHFVPADRELRGITTRVGIGVEVDTVEGELTIMDTYDGSTAQRTGLRIGDRVVGIDNQPLPNASVHSFYRMLRGEPGTSLRLHVVRGEKPDSLFFDLVRERIHRRNLIHALFLDSGIVYLKVERFGENAGNEVRTELLRLARHEHRLEDLRGLILDLRDNSGGILEEAIEVADAFLPKDDMILLTDGRDSLEREEWRAVREPVAPGIPLALLVNHRTASASEVVAGAVQDNDRGVIVGEPTLGKGLVQSVRFLPFDASLRLTTSWYVTPSGRSLQRLELLSPEVRSIIPDSLVGIFSTSTGRSVRGGEGIVPDIDVAALGPASLLGRLRKVQAFFTFASRYAARLDSLPEDFNATPELMEEFKLYALRKLTDYEEKEGVLATLDSLRGTLRNARENKVLAQRWEELRQEIIANDREAFSDLRDIAAIMLEHEIRRIFLDHQRSIPEELEIDKQFEAARSILLNKQAYLRILNRD